MLNGQITWRTENSSAVSEASFYTNFSYRIFLTSLSELAVDTIFSYGTQHNSLDKKNGGIKLKWQYALVMSIQYTVSTVPASVQYTLAINSFEHLVLLYTLYIYMYIAWVSFVTRKYKKDRDYNKSPDNYSLTIYTKAYYLTNKIYNFILKKWD